MGRMRRYKKFKAIDPFAKGGGIKKGRKSDDLDRNLPPDVKNHQAQRMDSRQDKGKKKAKRRLPQWAQDEIKETAKRVREEHSDPQGKGQQPQPQRPVIEGKREDESMREFRRRVQGRRTQLLKESFQEHSASRKKKKSYMDEKKRKNKLKKQGLWEEVRRRELLDEKDDADEDGRGSSSTGADRKRATMVIGGRRSRSSSGGGGRVTSGEARGVDNDDTAFPGAERIRFGEVAHAPPDLAKIPKPKGLNDQGQAKPWARGFAGTPQDEASRGIYRNVSRMQQLGQRGAISETGEAGESPDFRKRQGRVAEGEKAQHRQMEEMRQRVQEAYTGLKKKRRAGQTQYVSSDL